MQLKGVKGKLVQGAGSSLQAVSAASEVLVKARGEAWYRRQRHVNVLSARGRETRLSA
jgi:hypothetical protein